MFLVDTVEGRIVSDMEIKQKLASRQPYAEWVKENQITIDELLNPRACTIPMPRLCCADSAPSDTPMKICG